MNNISFYYRRILEKVRIHKVNRISDLSDVTIISQNCIGGVMYHDCNSKFLSPTINLFIMPKDFMKFVNNLDEYLMQTPKMIEGKEYPVGCFSDGLKIYFMHYESKDDALKKWESRKKRINRDKIFIVAIERDGFNEKDYNNFCNLTYPKILFTRNEEWRENSDCVYLSKYKNETQVPDIIFKREMYHKYALPKKIKKVFDK